MYQPAPPVTPPPRSSSSRQTMPRTPDSQSPSDTVKSTYSTPPSSASGNIFTFSGSAVQPFKFEISIPSPPPSTKQDKHSPIPSTTPPPTMPFNMSSLSTTLPTTPPTPPVNSARNTTPTPSRTPRSRPRHEVADEVPPDDRFHNPEFQASLTSLRTAVGGLEKVLRGGGESLERLRADAKELAGLGCPETRRVGLVGESGVGKSSVLNSLLDVGVARASNSGAACTCVATEFRHHKSDDFHVAVEVFTEAEIQDQIVELMRAFRKFHFDAKEMNAEEKKHWKERAELARDTFAAMFGSQSESVDKMLRTRENEGVLQSRLFKIAAECRPESLATMGAMAFPSAEECSAQLTELTSEGSTRGPARWPYIKKVTVHLNSYVLSKGLVLVDLPGLRDLNTARQKITETYLQRCDEIFAVCSIGRATTDEGVANVFRLAKEAKLANIGIICTRSDDIQAAEAVADPTWAGQTAKMAQELMKSLKMEEDKLAQLKADLDAEEDEDERKEMYPPIFKQEALVREHDFKLKNYIITTRNTRVTCKLDSMPLYRLPGGDLRTRIFCVSNTLYWKKRNAPKDKALPFLQLSGIIGLRRHCLAIVSESQFRIATSFINDSIPDLISRAGLWVQSGLTSQDAEKKRAVTKALNDVESQLRIAVKNPVSDIAEQTMGLFMDHILENCQFEVWASRARGVSRDWDGLHHATYAAFCRKYGVHNPNRGEYRDWNQEVGSQTIEDLVKPWEVLCSALRKDLKGLNLEFSAAFKLASGMIGESREVDGQIAEHIQRMLVANRNLVVSKVNDLQLQLEKNLRIIAASAFRSLNTSFFRKCMDEAYTDANCQSGSGCTVLKKSIINNRLSDPSLFGDWFDLFRDRYETLADRLDEDIEEAVSFHLSVIREALDIIRNDNATNESEDDPQLRARIANAVEMLRIEMERVQNGIKEESDDE